MDTVAAEGYTVRATFFANLGWIELLVLPLSKRALTSNPLMLTVPEWFWKSFRVTHCGKCRRPGSWNLFYSCSWYSFISKLLQNGPSDILSKLHYKQDIFEQGWLLFPQKNQVEASDSTGASVLESVLCWSSVWIVLVGTAALTDEGEIEYNLVWTYLTLENELDQTWSSTLVCYSPITSGGLKVTINQW